MNPLPRTTNEPSRSEPSSAGVRTLDDVLSAIPGMRTRPRALSSRPASSSPTQVTAPARSPRVRILPLRVDGFLLSPGECPDEQVHLLVDRSTFQRGEVEAFTDPVRVAGRLRERHDGDWGLPRPRRTLGGPATAYVFQHANFQGDSLSVDRRHVKRDLTQDPLGEIREWSTSWNHQISSVRTTTTHVVLFEHVRMRGSSLTIADNTQIANLTSFGWNDRVSSIANEHWV